MKTRFLFACLFFCSMLPTDAIAQVFKSYIDSGDKQVNEAVDFYISYFTKFRNGENIDYSQYWPADVCRKFKTPDLAVYAISSDYPTYTFGEQNTIFYAKRNGKHVHIKSILSYKSNDSTNTVFAILNHYVRIPTDGKQSYQFIPPVEINDNSYATKQFGNIEYHFPASETFNAQKAKSLEDRLNVILKKWKFNPVKITYYFTRTQEEMSAMKGFDYRYGDELDTPSGISFPEEKLVFSVMTPEDNLHEVLHVYFNPLYEKSPVNHGMIYYLAGGLGHDFQWFINRMHEYMLRYPETDLSQFDSIESQDIMLHIDFTIMGMICKKVDEKEGVAGLKRLLQYKSVDDLFQKEFKIKRKDWHKFLVKLIAEQKK